MRTFPIQTHPRLVLGLQRGETAPACPVRIPWELIATHEKQALSNHGQTLDELARRSGLSPSETVAVLEDRDRQEMTAEAACGRLCELTREWHASYKDGG